MEAPLIYDLYTGTGTIANFVASRACKVIGIEYVPEAIEDAKINSKINGIENTEFYAGDMKDVKKPWKVRIAPSTRLSNSFNTASRISSIVKIFD